MTSDAESTVQYAEAFVLAVWERIAALQFNQWHVIYAVLILLLFKFGARLFGALAAVGAMIQDLFD